MNTHPCFTPELLAAALMENSLTTARAKLARLNAKKKCKVPVEVTPHGDYLLVFSMPSARYMPSVRYEMDIYEGKALERRYTLNMLTGKRYEDVRVLARHANVVRMARAVWDAAQAEYEMQCAL